MAAPYLLDTNFFIEAHRTTFPFDVVPSFWEQVAKLARDGAVWSIDKVYAEMEHHEDQLKSWIRSELPASFFQPSDGVLGEYSRVANWAASRSGHYSDAALATFLDADEADAWLVAHAMQRQCPLLTHEVSQPEMKRAIKLPEPCRHFGLRFLNTIQMFRELGVRI